MDNFVDVVGFQLEKVHTGVIKWCLESKDEPRKKQETVLTELYSKYLDIKMPFNIQDVKEVICYPEHSFGRKLRIDLLIKIITTEGNYYIACEMKVDSEPYDEQLDNIVSNVNEHYSDSAKNDYLLILIGSSTVMRHVGDSHSDFKVITNQDLINLFSCMKDDSYIVSDWLVALENEVQRKHSIFENFIDLQPDNKLWSKKEHQALGYRPFFSTYYYLYHYMKKYAQNAEDWHIYSGSNNPVMNLHSGWETVGDFRFYWEFNYLEFCLKVKIDKNRVSRKKLNDLREILFPLLEKTHKTGKRSQKRYGSWNTIFKWSFDISKQNCQEIFRDIENDILPSYPEIQRLAKSI